MFNFNCIYAFLLYVCCLIWHLCFRDSYCFTCQRFCFFKVFWGQRWAFRGQRRESSQSILPEDVFDRFDAIVPLGPYT